MKIVTQINQLREIVSVARKGGRSIGLVPTMGFLHDGHLSLMHEARSAGHFVVVSIFVNPLQFGPNEDFAVYPRDLDRDAQLAEGAGADVVFVPAVEEMYPDGYEGMQTFVEVLGVSEGLCGASRPGHFRGVATVVTKLFNIVKPDVAYFGQKDAQQVAVIKRMVRDLNLDLDIVAVPIVREADGLALSSRNIYLGEAERKAALVLSRSLALAAENLRGGERDAARVIAAMREMIGNEPLAAIDYIAITDPDTLVGLDIVDRPALVALAVWIGKTRLIDNIGWEG